MASNGYQYECRQKHKHTLALAYKHTHKNTNTFGHSWQVPRTLRWESSFSSVPYQKQYIFHTLLTQNAEVRIYKLHMHTHTHTNLKETTKDVISFYEFLPLWWENKCVSPNPSFLQEWFLWSHEERHLLLCFFVVVFFFLLLSFDQVEKCDRNMSDRWISSVKQHSGQKMKVGNIDADTRLSYS